MMVRFAKHRSLMPQPCWLARFTGFVAHSRLSLAAAFISAMAAWAAPAMAEDRAAQPLDLPFTQFFKYPIGSGGLQLSEALLAADGRQVRLQGYMVQTDKPTPGQLLLAPVPIRLSEHADGEADDLPPATVTVLLASGHGQRLALHRQGPMALTGRLSVGRSEDPDGRISWIRLQLPEEAMASAASLPGSAARHSHP